MSQPLRKHARKFYVFGAVILFVGFLGFLVDPTHGWPAVAASAAIATLYVIVGRATTIAAVVSDPLNATTQLVARGELDEASRVLDGIPALSPHVVRLLATQRAFIAVARGEMDRVDEIARPAIEGRVGVLTRSSDEVHRAEALALRALARAARGENEAAIADATRVNEDRFARPSALARAALSRAIVAAGKDDRQALVAELRASGELMLEHTMPRERTLVRALRRLARSPGKSVYREQGRRVEEEAAHALDAWAARVVPGAAPFVGGATADAAGAALPAAGATEKTFAKIARDRRWAAKGARRAIPRWKAAMIAVLIVGGGYYVATAPRSVDPGAFGASFLTFAMVMLCVTFFGVFLYALTRGRSIEARTFAATREALTGDAAKAERSLTELAKIKSSPLTVASASDGCALVAWRRGDFAGGLAWTDRGIGTIVSNPSHQVAASLLQTPLLLEHRAWLLAALGRDAEAEGELATIASAHPAFPFLGRAAFVVRLLAALRRHDFPLAAQVAATRTSNMPLDLRTDLLADVVLAASGSPMGEDERQRIAAELSDMAEIAGWIDRLSPGLVERARLGVRVAIEEEEIEEPASHEAVSSAAR